MATSKKDQILQLFKQMDVVRPRDAESAGIAGSYLNALYSKGILERPSRGLYILPNSEPSEFRSIVEACKLSPNATVCLLSALRIHDLTTQSPYEVWLAIGGEGPQTTNDLPSDSNRPVLRSIERIRDRETKTRGCNDLCLLGGQDSCRLFQVSQKDRTRCSD
jgi:hypothetical protein